ncbi:Aste57867_21439 [Aphanomyces stellatus]|uniref:Aste57867_21439 protein n=1 Tax=Aphanomyces stellatus TaxID=120398 RepID=A0A485LIT1_9STRA|nr:hypothetical protein As57867_021370 [Aphanomyces stellatus]VFT98110.1 Aste57867_21439 [Aphanomyces stellatus]
MSVEQSNNQRAVDSIIPDSVWLHPVLELSTVKANLNAFKDETIAMLLARMNGHGIIPQTWNVGPDKKAKGIQVYWGDVQNSEWPAMKTVGKIHASVETCADILADINMGPRLDKFTRTGRVVHRFDEGTDLRYFETHGFMIIEPRDFCVISTTKRLPDGRMVIASRSIMSPEFGKKYGYSRGQALLSGYVMAPQKTDVSKCEAAVYAHIDFGGTFPSALIKMFGLAAPIKIFEQLQTIAAERTPASTR